MDKQVAECVLLVISGNLRVDASLWEDETGSLYARSLTYPHYRYAVSKYEHNQVINTHIAYAAKDSDERVIRY